MKLSGTLTTVFLSIVILCFQSCSSSGPNQSRDAELAQHTELAEHFPNEDNETLAVRVEADLNQEKQNEDVGNAWAKLEHSMLSKELEGEE